MQIYWVYFVSHILFSLENRSVFTQCNVCANYPQPYHDFNRRSVDFFLGLCSSHCQLVCHEPRSKACCCYATQYCIIMWYSQRINLPKWKRDIIIVMEKCKPSSAVISLTLHLEKVFITCIFSTFPPYPQRPSPRQLIFIPFVITQN